MVPNSTQPIDLSPATWQTTLLPSSPANTASVGPRLVMPLRDSRFILAQLVAIPPTSQDARMTAYKRFVNAPTSLPPATSDRQQPHVVSVYEIRLADVAWDYERGRPMHPLALRVCTNERIVGSGGGGGRGAVPDLGVCTCDEGTCCGMPKEVESKGKEDAMATESSCCGSSKPLPPPHPPVRSATATGAASKDGPLPRYECATGTCAPIASDGDSFAAPRMPSCCGGSGGGDSQDIALTSSNPRTWANRVLVGYLRLSFSTTHSDPSPGTPTPTPTTGDRHGHHVQLDLESDGPGITVPGLVPHIFTVIATHITRGGGKSDGVLSSIKRSLKQQRPAGDHDHVFVAVWKRDLALRVAIKQMGSVWAVLPAATTEDGDDSALHVVYVAKLTDLLASHSHHE